MGTYGKKLAAYTAVCAEDEAWVPQYLAEVERLGVPFAVHLDRCRIDALTSHPLCVGATSKESGEFSERDKQGVIELLAERDFEWGMAWDIDETWEPGFAAKLAALFDSDFEYVDCPWVNVWDDGRVRTDGTFGAGHRVKFYRLNRRWKFTHPIVNGAKHIGGDEPREGKLPIVCVHHGMRTREMRLAHKERWDRIYTHHVGNNPYGFWAHALDETITPSLCTLDEYLERHALN